MSLRFGQSCHKRQNTQSLRTRDRWLLIWLKVVEQFQECAGSKEERLRIMQVK